MHLNDSYAVYFPTSTVVNSHSEVCGDEARPFSFSSLTRDIISRMRVSQRGSENELSARSFIISCT